MHRLRAVYLFLAMALLVLGLSLARSEEKNHSQGQAGAFDYYLLSLSWSPEHCAEPAGANDHQQCGDPMSPLRWTCKSEARLAAELQNQGHVVSERTVNRLLHELGYSLQSNRKTLEGCHHPDRDAQFQYINRRVKAFQRQGQPVVSVDTKKKELVGQFRHGGREWRLTGQPEEVKVHDFPDEELGKIIPYGVYDMATNTGWVSVGVDHDTAGVVPHELNLGPGPCGAPASPREDLLETVRQPKPATVGDIHPGEGRQEPLRTAAVARLELGNRTLDQLLQKG